MGRPETERRGTHDPDLNHSSSRRRPVVFSAILAATLGSWAAPASAENVLVYDDNTKANVAQAACTNLGHTCTRALRGDFTTLLTGGPWDLVVMDMPSDEPTGDWQAALETFVAEGGAAIHTHWHSSTVNALPSAFDVVIGAAHGPLDFWQWNAHPLFAFPNEVPAVFDQWVDEWFTNGLRLAIMPASGAETPAGFTGTPTAGEAAVVIGNEGRTIWNGFVFDDYAGADKDDDGKDDIVELVENQMSLVLDAPVPSEGCPVSPAPTCRQTSKGSLLVQEGRAGRERLVAKLQKGTTFTQTDLGNPTVPEGTTYHLCIYGAEDTLVANIEVARAAHTCNGATCWNTIGRAAPDGKGYRYRDGAGEADGVTLMNLKAGKRPSLTIVAKNNAKRGRIGLRRGMTAGLTGADRATIQLHGSDAAVCVSSALTKVRVATPARFQAS